MHKIGVDERVGEKGPKIGGETAGKCARDAGIGAIARRDEREGQKKIDVLVVRQHQHAEDMNEKENADGRHDDHRHIENGLANWRSDSGGCVTGHALCKAEIGLGDGKNKRRESRRSRQTRGACKPKTKGRTLRSSLLHLARGSAVDADDLGLCGLASADVGHIPSPP